MQKNSHKTAILIFSQSAARDAKSKHYLGVSNYLLNKEICDFMVRDTMKMIANTGLDHFLIDETLQVGSDFGNRLSNAFQFVFDKGFERIICIGNDCPTLSSKDIHLASEKLIKGKVIVGPNKRGGIYLLGLTKENFKKSGLSTFKWQSSSLFDELSSFWKDDMIVFESKRDLNTFHDANQMRKFSPQTDWVSFFKKIEAQVSQPQYTTVNIPCASHLQHSGVGLRAPPTR